MDASRKILILSATFFPDPTVAAVRMTQWCKYLPVHHWKPLVLCRYYGYECRALELAACVHPDVTVEFLDRRHCQPASEGRPRLRRVARRAIDPVLARRGLSSLAVPDVSIWFWRGIRHRVLQRVHEFRPAIILTSSPPASIHDLGLWLSKRTGIPWVADFRDAHLLDHRSKPQGLGLIRGLAHHRFNEGVHNGAQLVTHAIPTGLRWARRRYRLPPQRLMQLTNAYPPDVFQEMKPVRRELVTRDTVLVAGTIPEPEQLRLGDAVARLVEEGRNVELKLVGLRPADEWPLRRVLGDRLVLTGYLPHSDAVREIHRARVLVSFLDDFRRATLVLSTKLFEYLASGNPVVCLNPSRSDRFLVSRMSGVAVLDHPGCEDIAGVLRQALDGRLCRNPAELLRFRAEFSWPRRAAQLATALNRIVASAPAAAVDTDDARPRLANRADAHSTTA